MSKKTKKKCIGIQPDTKCAYGNNQNAASIHPASALVDTDFKDMCIDCMIAARKEKAKLEILSEKAKENAKIAVFRQNQDLKTKCQCKKSSGITSHVSNGCYDGYDDAYTWEYHKCKDCDKITKFNVKYLIGTLNCKS